MEENEMLELTSETENIETQTIEENEEGIELTDTTDADEVNVNEPEKEEVKKTLRELLKENPDYQDEFNEMIKPRLNRKDREYQKELSKYKDTENVLRSTLNVKDNEDVNEKLREYYENEGVKLPNRYEPGLSSKEIEALAKSDVEDIAAEGDDAIFNEAERLANIGYNNLNEREKAVFNSLAEKLTKKKEMTELQKLGADEKLLEDKEFISFKSQFNSNTPIKTIFELYQKTTNPKADIKPMGSMKDTNTKNSTEKDYYTPEDVMKLTDEEWNDPKVWANVRASQIKWK